MAIGTGEPQEVEYKVRLPSGAESHHWSAVIPELDASGKVIGLHGTDQDISARKELDRLQTHVAHLSRVEAMNAMAATLAHELNQPLTSASNYLVGSRRRLKGDGAGALEAAAEGMAAAEAAGPSRRRHHPPGARDGLQPAEDGGRGVAERGSSTMRSR